MDYINGITTWSFLAYFKETSTRFQDSPPVHNSNIVFELLHAPQSPPKSTTPLPSGNSAIAVFHRTYGKDAPVIQKKRE